MTAPVVFEQAELDRYRNLEYHGADEDSRNDHDIPHMSCPRCQIVCGLPPRLGPANQYYFCGGCDRIWCLPGPVGIPMVGTSRSLFTSVWDAVQGIVWICVTFAVLVFVIAYAALVITHNHLQNDWRILAVLGLAVLAYIVIIGFVGVLYSLLIAGIERGGRYVWGPPMRSFVRR